MECQAWSQEFETLAPPLTLGPWMTDCLSVRGANTLQVPLVVPPGAQEVPTLRGRYEGEDTRTGIFFPPGAVALTIHGWEKFRWTCAGMVFQDNGFSLVLGTLPLTADREINLPDESGTVALKVEFNRANGEAFSIQRGQPVRLEGSEVKLALADTYLNRAIGLALQTTAAGDQVSIMVGGFLEQEDWTNVLGTVSLIPGTEYFLNPGAGGAITDVPPETAGMILQYLGVAVTNQKLLVELERPYEL